MYGAILGDIVGSPYEFDCNNYKAKDFPLFSRRSDFTDDTVMTLAVAKALLSTRGQDDAAIKAALVREMQQLGRAYPDRGYHSYDELPLFLNAELVAKVLGVSISSAYELMHEEVFPSVRIGSRFVVPKDKFQQWVEWQTGGAR